MGRRPFFLASFVTTVYLFWCDKVSKRPTHFCGSHDVAPEPLNQTLTPPRHLRPILSWLLGTIKPERRKIIFTLVLSILAAGCGIFYPYLIGFVVDAITLNNPVYSLPRASLMTLACLLLYWPLSTVAAFLIARIDENILCRMRKETISHLMHLRPNEMIQQTNSQIISRFAYDMENISGLFTSRLIDFTQNIIILLGALIIAFSISVRMTLTLLAILPIILPILFLILHHTFLQAMTYHQTLSMLTAKIADLCRHLPLIKIYALQERVRREIDTSFSNLRAQAIHYRLIHLTVQPFMAFVGITGLTVILLTGSGLAWGGTIRPGQFVAYIIYASAALGALSSMISHIMELYQSAGGIANIYALHAIPTESISSPPPPTS
ncbi:MAG: ABC transporter ATP-binding protein [Lentisphaerae bacterium]|nr:MAG: ABC transporter ATP-binding protein [Lentisphaerota bacterium]